MATKWGGNANSSGLRRARWRPTGPATIGGVKIGAAGTGILAGYVLAAGDEFTALDLISAANPGGRYGTGRAYSNGGMRGPASGPLAVMHDVSPDYTGWADSNRGAPIASLSDSHTIVAGEGGGALRLRARRQTAPEQAKLSTGVAGQIENGAMIHGAADIWVNSPAAVSIRARLPAGLYGQHPTLWLLSAYPPGGPSFTGNEYGWEGGRTENEPYLNSHVSGTPTQYHGAKSNTYRDANFHTFTVVTSTDYKFYADGTLQHTVAQDPNANGNKPDYLIVSNHIYNAAFEGQTYDAADWAANPGGAAIDIEWVQYWRPAGGAHYAPKMSIADTFVTAGAALNIALPSQSALWGATGLAELVTAVALEREQPGISSNTATFGLMPSGVSYDGGTRVIGGTVPAQAGLLIFAIGITGDGNTCKTARARVFVAPVFKGQASRVLSPGAVSIDGYAEWDAGRLLPMSFSGSGMPSGVAVNPVTGEIAGTYVSGSGTMAISCTNSAGQTTTQNIAYGPAAGVAAPTLTGNPPILASWDAGNAATITASGGAVDSIAGADGTSFTLSGSGSNRPTQETRGGTAALRFTSASAQFLQIASALGANSANGVTVVTVIEPATTAASQAALDIANGASTGALNRLSQTGGAGGWGSRKASASSQSDANVAGTFTTARRLVISVYKPTTAGAATSIDGTSTPVTSGTGQAWPTGLSHTTLGSRRVSNAQDLPLNGWWFRTVVYGAELNATQLEECAVHYNTYYGTPNNA